MGFRRKNYFKVVCKVHPEEEVIRGGKTVEEVRDRIDCEHWCQTCGSDPLSLIVEISTGKIIEEIQPG